MKRKVKKEKKQYVVLVPLSANGMGEYRYEIRGGFFASIKDAQAYMKRAWAGELMAVVGKELSKFQRTLVGKQKREE